MNIVTAKHEPEINVPVSLIKTALNNGYSKVFLPLTEFEGFSLVYIPTRDIHSDNDSPDRAHITLTSPLYYVYPQNFAKAKMDAVDLALSFNAARTEYLSHNNELNSEDLIAPNI